MIYCFDIDGTICTMEPDHDYRKASPFGDVIDEINRLYKDGNTIRLATARGNGSGLDWKEFTHQQMEEWGVKYHHLCVGKKLGADVYVDDKAINIEDFRKNINPRKGIVAGAFDIIHAGYIKMFLDAKAQCDHLIVALHEDPSLERAKKIQPSQSLEDRKIILSSIKYIDEIISYKTELDFEQLLVEIKPDIRILGSDYRDKQFTGKDLGIDLYFHDRDHGRSTTSLKKDIASSLGFNT